VTTADTGIVAGSVVAGFLDPGHWSACFGLSYRDLFVHDLANEQRLFRAGRPELRALTGAGGISSSRNKVARDFLDNTAGEWLWFVDSDMGFAPDTLNRLVESADPAARPVMGGLCFAGLRDRREKPPLYAERILIQPTVYEYVEPDGEVGFPGRSSTTPTTR
jgi:hypothetical protein